MENSNDKKELAALQVYASFERPFWKIALLSVILFFIILSVIVLILPFDKIVDTVGSWDRIIFSVYVCLFAATWIVYFRSKKKFDHNGDVYKDRPIQSLRRLLGESCINWDYNPCHSESEDVKEAFRRKASTSMEVIAILIAVSILILDIASNMLISNKTFDEWQEFSLGISSLMAVFSFVCFLISVDSLDTIFNRFRSLPDRNVIVHYFYHNTINPRYFGMLSMISAVILLLQVYSAMLASISISLILIVGYSHWFPDLTTTMEKFGIDVSEKLPCKRTSFGIFINNILLAMFISLPVVIHFSL